MIGMDYSDEKVKCPCCQKELSIKKCLHLQKWRKQLDWPGLGKIDAWQSDDMEERDRWACDSCIKKGRALIGNIEKQNYGGYGMPFPVYLDIDRTCISCGENYIYKKEDQQYWYETLHKNVWSRASRCLSCRKPLQKVRKSNQRLQYLVMNVDLNNEEELKELIEIFKSKGNLEKAKYYFSVLKKLDPTYVSLDQL